MAYRNSTGSRRGGRGRTRSTNRKRSTVKRKSASRRTTSRRASTQTIRIVVDTLQPQAAPAGGLTVAPQATARRMARF